MRLHRIILSLLTIAIILALAFTSPAIADVRNCKQVYATLDTLVVEDSVEIGEVQGTINGAAYLRYNDAEPPIDPQVARPNLVITSKLGAINLWVYSALKPDGDSWWRSFKVLRAEGTGMYANQRIILEIYGKCSPKEGSYEIEGMICAPFVLPPKK